ncbi:insulinase family protein [Sphingobacterium sp. DK4209]|uniref:Insulinase family protein n=1 Tax=Sphingobacterium zhuxiongii TaxID=2662364 RepID=A0A5Q0QJ32_9SPHI|nr:MULTISPECIES: pitrilysin family protein [unclassified Sphingobacterium]MVZ66787.1 insulinase family protein [Sphingobacterium sp. DK4209]QGA28022.1 insulinase family protein [Sphingobacterium sp. dk4302]
MDHKIFQLENGLRILLHPQVSSITHACLIVDVGSRHEQFGKFGTAHFIEHLLFKKTERRSTNQILNRLESVGGDLNAYTTKEYTCIQASFLNPYLDRALDLFEDIIFHSLFPEDEMEKEKGVILDEMASYLDSPEESIMDDFEDQIFKGSGLGHNILGLEDDLKGIVQDDIKTFISQHYATSKMVIAIAGDYDEKKLLKLANKLFGQVKVHEWDHVREDVSFVGGTQVELQRPINQVHCVLGSTAYSIYDDRKTGLLLLNSLLGGFGMASILNLNIREKYGIAYTIESNYSLYSDTGLFSIYFGTDEEKAEKALKLVHKELNKLKDQPLSESFLLRAKTKFKGQIALAEENRMSMIIAEAKNLLDYDRVISLQEVFDKIDAVTVADIHGISNDLFADDKLSSLTFLPED